jgi:hypothetical protein
MSNILDKQIELIDDELWEARWDYVKSKYSNWLVYAWCKPASLPLLLEKGFVSGEICTYVEKTVD